MIDALLLWL